MACMESLSRYLLYGSLHIKKTSQLFVATYIRKSTLSSVNDVGQRCFSHGSCLRKGQSSNQWLQRQAKDIYVKRAKIQSYRCRSAFKLIEMDDRYKFLRSGSIVVDCGAAPGAWSQVAVQRTNADGNDVKQRKGQIISFDLQHIQPIHGATIVGKADIRLPETYQRVSHALSGQKADVVLSDMAPAASGAKELDHELVIQLCFAVLLACPQWLSPGGTFLCKLWQGAQQKTLESALQKWFNTVKVVKPLSSRGDSAEIYLLAQGFQESPG